MGWQRAPARVAVQGQVPPATRIDENNKLTEEAEPTYDIITWLFEENSFVPCAKLVGNERYSIISDYIGRPTHCYDEKGELVWHTDYDIYGKLRNLQGEKGFIPFRQLGQYEDDGLGLYYNRFRYYDADSGLYLSQDPIGLNGGMPNFYSYVEDCNRICDPFGLEKCLLSPKDKKKLKSMFSDDGIPNPHDHHIVREKAPAGWPREYQDYVTKSQDIIKKEGIGLNDDIRNFTRAQNGGGAHTQKAAKHVYEQLSSSTNIQQTMKEHATNMNKGIFY